MCQRGHPQCLLSGRWCWAGRAFGRNWFISSSGGLTLLYRGHLGTLHGKKQSRGLPFPRAAPASLLGTG